MSKHDSKKNGSSKQSKTPKSKTAKGGSTMKKAETTQQGRRSSKKTKAGLKRAKSNPATSTGSVKQHKSAGEDLPLNTAQEYEVRAAQKLRDGDNEGAARDMASAVRMNPNDIGLLCKLGFVSHKTGRRDEAIRVYNDALSLTLNHSPLQPNVRYRWKVEILSRRANSLYEKDEHQKSLEDCNRVIELIKGWDAYPEGNGFYQRALLARGKIFLKLNEFSSSLKDLRQLREIAPKYPEASLMLAIAIDANNKRESMLGNYDNREAIEYYDEAIRLDPDYKNAFFHRGNARFGEKQFKLSRMDYEAVLHLDPEHADALASLGKVYLEMREREKAISLCKRALEINPDGRRGRDIVYVYGFVDARDVLKAARNLKDDAEDQNGRDRQGGNPIDDELSEDDVLCT